MVLLSYMVVFSTLFVHFPFLTLLFRKKCVVAVCLSWLEWAEEGSGLGILTE